MIGFGLMEDQLGGKIVQSLKKKDQKSMLIKQKIRKSVMKQKLEFKD